MAKRESSERRVLVYKDGKGGSSARVNVLVPQQKSIGEWFCKDSCWPATHKCSFLVPTTCCTQKTEVFKGACEHLCDQASHVVRDVLLNAVEAGLVCDLVAPHEILTVLVFHMKATGICSTVQAGRR
jgi:hypothetical protein